jgi:flagellar biogenesis protein FliO
VKVFLRILIAIACVIALYYLVVVLARSVAEQDTSSSPPTVLQETPGQDADPPSQ